MTERGIDSALNNLAGRRGQEHCNGLAKPFRRSLYPRAHHNAIVINQATNCCIVVPARNLALHHRGRAAMAPVDPEKDAALGNHVSSPISDKDPNARPECFRSTFQECLFVMSVTMAVAMSSFLTGAITVMSSFAGRDLGMSNAEITWMNAAAS